MPIARSHQEQHETIGLERGALNMNPTTPTSVKIAALEALEALLTVVSVLQARTLTWILSMMRTKLSADS